jgi:Family of unknown function (DUF5681)
MTKRQAPDASSTATRFKRGQSGNPKGRPRKPKPPVSSPFAILDELLTVHEPGSVPAARGRHADQELSARDHWQPSPLGRKSSRCDPRARKAPPQRRAPRSPRITSQIEEDPENALDALEILGVASRTAGANAGDSRNAHLRLERWAVEAALRRRNFEELSSSDLHLIRRCTLDGDAVKWPRSSLHHA